MLKVWTVYEISNTLNDFLYIGVHKTGDPDDSYLGSGDLIKEAILELGADKFSKRIIQVFDNRDEAYALERDLVTWERIWRGGLYNKKPGGDGGWEQVIQKKFLIGKEGNTMRRLKSRLENLKDLEFFLLNTAERLVKL